MVPKATPRGTMAAVPRAAPEKILVGFLRHGAGTRQDEQLREEERVEEPRDRLREQHHRVGHLGERGEEPNAQAGDGEEDGQRPRWRMIQSKPSSASWATIGPAFFRDGVPRPRIWGGGW